MLDSYILYSKFITLHKLKDNMLTHCKFQESVTLAWLFPKKYWPSRFSNQRKKVVIDLEELNMDDASTSTSARIRNVLVTNMSLTPTGYLQNKLNKILNHLLVPCTKPEPICQLYR